MHTPVRSIGLSAVFLAAVALVAGPPLDNGSGVCLGSIGHVVCVPPEEFPPTPPNAPNPPPGMPEPPSSPAG